MKISRRSFVKNLCGSLASASLFTGFPIITRGQSPVRIALFAPLSGPQAIRGKTTHNGAKLAIEEINAEGGVLGSNLELIGLDLGASSIRQLTDGLHFVRRENVLAVIGPWLTRGNNLAQAAERVELPVFLPNPYTEELFSSPSNYLFRIPPGAHTLATKTVEYLADSAEQAGVSIKNVSIFRWQLPYIKESAAIIQRTARTKGWDVVFEFDYPLQTRPDSIDFKDPVLEAKAKETDLVIYMGGVYEAPSFVRTINQYALNAKAIVGNFSVAFSNPNEVQKHGGLFTDIMDMNVWWDPKHPDIKQLQEKFHRQFNELLSNEALHAYTVIYALKDALRSTGVQQPRELAAMLRQLEIPKRFLAQQNQIKFDRYGRNEDATPLLLQVTNPVKVKYPRPFSEGAPKFN